MTMTPVAFSCPLCEAKFKVVRIEATAEGPEYPVFCPACETQLPSRDNGAILKYFLVAEPAHGSHRQRPKSAAVRSSARPAPGNPAKA